MSDSERDAWLREALRHAPDADAAPPPDLSETILAQARAAARRGGAPARAARRRNPVVALWDWLARPSVAAGFASVMAATLVGLMWWDRPIDETRPRSRDTVLSRQAPSPPSAELGSATAKITAPDRDAPAQRAAAEARAPAATVPAAAPTARVDGLAPPPQAARRPGIEAATPGNNKLASPAAKIEAPELRKQAAPANAAMSEAKEQEGKLEAATDAARPDRAAAKPAPFPRSDDERSAATLDAAAKKKDSDARDGKTSDRLSDPRPAKSLPAPAPAAPAEALRSEPPAAFAEQRANEVAQTSPMTSAGSEAAKRARVAGAAAQTAPATAATAAATPPAAPAPAAPPALRDSASVELRDKQANAFGSSRSAQAPSDLARAQRGGAVATPLAPILAALASDPARWSRSTAAGTVAALDPGWRDWLAQLDAVARDRWQQSSAENSRERESATTLRLVDGGRTAAVVRLDGTTVRVETTERGEHWQATLPPEAAERLRVAAERLGR